MSARFYLDTPDPASWRVGETLSLSATAARHVQVLRLQPGSALTLFHGHGGEWTAEITQMGRQNVDARLLAHHDVDRELVQRVSLAIGMPANERMDWLIEKATELGVASIIPLTTQRSIVRLDAARAERRRAHWQSIAISACEQCGRNRVPSIAAPTPLLTWLPQVRAGRPFVLSLTATASPWSVIASSELHDLTLLSGPEGGLSPEEESQALRAGFAPVSLGTRVLRAETAPLAVLAALGLRAT